MTGEEIKRRLVDFARKWSMYKGSERAEAQTFLNELFACYGADRQAVGARFEEAQRGKFLDLIWPRRCIVEMKRPSEAKRLATHREQALSYWRSAATRRAMCRLRGSSSYARFGASRSGSQGRTQPSLGQSSISSICPTEWTR